MNDELRKAIELLIRSEVELDAWKDMRPDAAGETTQLLVDIKAFIHEHQPEHFTPPNENTDSSTASA